MLRTILGYKIEIRYYALCIARGNVNAIVAVLLLFIKILNNKILRWLFIAIT